jgi:NhaP-type Na+/H+ or K+/H+ antiporter
MFFTGFVVFASAALLLAKIKRRLMLKALHREVLIDVAVSAVTLAIHWGTFSGVMAATIAGLWTSVATSVAKKLFGYIKGNTYYPGVFVLDPDAA